MRTGFYPEPGKYLAFARRCFDITEAGGSVRIFWNGEHLDYAGWRQEFRKALQARINLKARMLGELPPETGRKHDPNYQAGLMRDARRIDSYVQFATVDPVNRLETPELQSRFNWRYTADGLEVDLPCGVVRNAAWAA